MPSLLETFFLYANTAKFLKPIQITNRLTRKFQRKKISHISFTVTRQTFDTPHFLKKKTCFRLPDEFVFMEESGKLSEIGWRGEERSLLWRYHQHYFDWLICEDHEHLEHIQSRIIENWMKENQVGCGPAWDPYPSSLRIVNWIKYVLFSGELDEKALQSLAAQSEHLYNNIEWHLLANHLFVNAKALYFAGLFFEGEMADKWLRAGEKILMQQLQEQILSDGGHFERTPMYHALILEDCLDLLEVIRLFQPSGAKLLKERLHQKSAKMLAWLDNMTHRDGDIAFFNDACCDVAPQLSALKRYAEKIGVSDDSTGQKIIDDFNFMEASGFLRVRKPQYDVFLDYGEIVSNYQPGHSHAGMLSLEMAVEDQRLFVNSGISCYGTSAERLEQRSTRSHNTITLAEHNSAEIWSGFRVARRPNLVQKKFSRQSSRVSFAHDGYKRIDAKAIHERQVVFESRRLIIRDQMDSQKFQPIARYHIHPAWQIEKVEGGILCQCDSKKVLVHTNASDVWLEDTQYHPKFGQSLPNKCLCLHLPDGDLSVIIELF